MEALGPPRNRAGSSGCDCLSRGTACVPVWGDGKGMEEKMDLSKSSRMVSKAWWAYLIPGGLIFRTGMSILT